MLFKKDQIKIKRGNLENELEKLKEEEIQTTLQKEKEIKESSEILKQQMLHKIRQKKAELFSLKKDNFGEEIEIVIQQNYHYTNQLDYQTKHFEYLIIQNEKLRIQTENQGNDKAIHKNIQNELAKRVFLSNQIIIELKTKNSALEKHKEELTAKITVLFELQNNQTKKWGNFIQDDNFDFEFKKLLKEKNELTEIQKTFSEKKEFCKKRLFEFLNLIQFLIFLVARNKNACYNGTGSSIITKQRSFKAGQSLKGPIAKTMFLKKAAKGILKIDYRRKRSNFGSFVNFFN